MLEDAAALRAHPAFPQALRLHAERIAGNLERSRDLVRLTSEEAQLTLGIALTALHLARNPGDPRSGATLTRIRAFAARFRITSPNRVSALIGLKLHTGYWRQVEVSADRRVKRLEPTEKGEALSRLIAQSTLASIQLMSERFDYFSLLENDPDFRSRYSVEGINLYASGVRLALAVPDARFFMSKVAGRQIMFKLWLAFVDQQEGGSRIVSCPYVYLANCFGVSRGHVRRLVEAAQERGLLKVHAPGGHAIEILPRFVELQETFTSLAFALLKKAADLAASGSGRGKIEWGVDL
ncbi:hypothetical protein ACERNI_09090 [Camelimonas sp. ID_303_24]